MTLVELTVVVAVIAVIAAMAITRVFRAKLTANETSAIATVRVIANAQVDYSIGCGNGGFAPSLARLGLTPPGGRVAFLEQALARDPMLKAGFRFQTRPGAGSRRATTDCHGLDGWSNFYTSAVPQGMNETGTRSFAINQGGQVWVKDAVDAPTEPFGPPSHVLK